MANCKIKVITNKFNYTKISRETVEGKRLYATPDGKKVPSVTTILSATVPEEKKEILREWRERVGVEKAQQITTEAANRGTKMHTFLENYILEGKLADKPSNPFSWASHSMAQTIITNGLKNIDEYWGVEIPVYFPGIYAGTTDLAGVHLGSEAIMDHKQSNNWKREDWIDDYKIQLAAYAEAHNEVHGTKINKGVVFMAVKPKMNEQTMEIIEPPKYQEFVIQGADFDKWRKVWWDRVEQYYMKQ
jgi:genome maintenance exonuclease 1